MWPIQAPSSSVACHRNNKMETKTSVVLLIFFCSILRIKPCIGVIVEENFKDHPGRVIMDCSSDRVYIDINTQDTGADINDVQMTCMEDISFDVYRNYLSKTMIGPNQGGAATANVPLHGNSIIPGSICELHSGIYYLSATIDRQQYNLPTVICTIPASPPQITANTVIEGGVLNLTCINNNPTGVSQAWWDSEGILSTNETYTVENVTREDAGVYRCVLTGVNNYTVEHNVTVEVQYAPELVDQVPDTHTINISSNVTLSCAYDGVPSPVVRWLHNGIELSNVSEVVKRIDVDGRSVLTLGEVGVESGGEYICEVVNSIGSNLLSFTVIVITEEVVSTMFTEGAVDSGATTVTTFTATSNESTLGTQALSHSESKVLVIAEILIPMLILSSLTVAVTVFSILFHRWWKARKFNSYHIHFHLHSELDTSYVPVMVEIKKNFSRSTETILNARSYSDENENVKRYSLSSPDLQDTESVSSQRLSEFSILKPESLIGYCSGIDSDNNDKDNTSEHTQTRHHIRESHHLNTIDNHELKETTLNVSSIPHTTQQDYVCIDVMPHMSDSETENGGGPRTGDNESECESEILQSEYIHDGDGLALNIDCPEKSSNQLVSPSDYCSITSDEHQWRTRIAQDESIFMLDEVEEESASLDSLSMNRCTNDNEETDRLEENSKNVGNYVTSDFDTIVEEEELCSESHNQFKPHRDHLDTTGTNRTVPSGNGYVSEPAGMASSSNFDASFIYRKQCEPSSGYIASDESGYYSSQIPSECDSNYKLRQLLEDEECFVLGVDEDMPHLAERDLYSQINPTHRSCNTLKECDTRQVISATGEGYVQDPLSLPPQLRIPPHSSSNCMGAISEYVSNDEEVSSHFQTAQHEPSRLQSSPDNILWCIEEGDVPVERDVAVPLTFIEDTNTQQPSINTDRTQSSNNDDVTQNTALVSGHTSAHTPSLEYYSSSYYDTILPNFTMLTKHSDSKSLHPIHSNVTTMSCDGEYSTKSSDTSYTVTEDDNSLDCAELLEPTPSMISCAREDHNGYIPNEP